MNYLMLTYFTEEAARRWEQLDDAGRQADVEQHMAWFAEHGARIAGGHELAWPRQTAVLRAGHRPLVTDGPYLEVKEILGGVIVLEADSLEEAMGIASGWPSLAIDGALVEVVAEHQR